MQTIYKGRFIQLLDEEMEFAAMIGNERYNVSRERGNKQKFGIDQKTIQEQKYYDVLGARGELAFAIMARLHWPASVNADPRLPDVPPVWQIRTTDKLSHRLIVKTTDRDDQKFVLMCGEAGRFTFLGWTSGQDAKAYGEYCDPGDRGVKSYFVQQSYLKSVE